MVVIGSGGPFSPYSSPVSTRKLPHQRLTGRGRRRTIPDRNCFAAIVYMVRTSTPWRLLPAQELGCGSPATCWRRLTEWAKAGVFDQLHVEVLDRLGVDGELEWSQASVDTLKTDRCWSAGCWRVGGGQLDRAGACLWVG
jgi:transposase